jgi:hypothetical protein
MITFASDKCRLTDIGHKGLERNLVTDRSGEFLCAHISQ